MSLRKLCIFFTAISSVSAIAGNIEYLGADGHLPAVVCGGASGNKINIQTSLESLSSGLAQLRKELALKDEDLTISSLTHAVVSTDTMASIGNCVLVSPRTEKATLTSVKSPKDRPAFQGDTE